MKHWWESEEYARDKPMNFARRDDGPQEVILVPPSEEEIKEAPKNETPAHARVRIFVGR